MLQHWISVNLETISNEHAILFSLNHTCTPREWCGGTGNVSKAHTLTVSRYSPCYLNILLLGVRAAPLTPPVSPATIQIITLCTVIAVTERLKLAIKKISVDASIHSRWLLAISLHHRCCWSFVYFLLFFYRWSLFVNDRPCKQHWINKLEF